jgi:ribonuclease HI
MAYDRYSDTELVVGRQHFTEEPSRREDTVVYVDASHSPSCRTVFGYGVVLLAGGTAQHFSGVGMLPRLFADNHLAELLAAAMAINVALAMAEHGSTLRLLSDSVNALCVVAGHVPVTIEGDGHVGHGGGKRQRFNLKMSPMRTLNQTAIERLDLARQAARERQVSITLEHIKAHTKRPGEAYQHQAACDALARCARWNAERLHLRGRLVDRAV